MQETLSNFEGDDPSVEAGEIMAWLCVHDDVDGPKLRRLKKRLGTSDAEALGILAFLWFWGLKNTEESGLLKEVDREDIEKCLESRTNLDATKVVDELFDNNWLELREDGIYIHDWGHWQQYWIKSNQTKARNAERMRDARARAKLAEAAEQGEPVSEMPPQDEAPEKPPETTSPPKVPEEPKYTVEFEQFWKVYPRKIDKGMAYKKYQARRKDGFSDDQLIAAAANYAAQCRKQKTEKQYIKHPKTFLSDTMPFMDFLPKQSIMVTATVTSENPYAEWGDGHE